MTEVAVQVNTVMVRRLKKEVLKQLPPKMRNTVMLKVQNEEDKERLQELNKETQGISKVLNAAMVKAHKGNAKDEALFSSVGKDTQLQVMKAFTACADIKINLVIDHVVRLPSLFFQVPCSACMRFISIRISLFFLQLIAATGAPQGHVLTLHVTVM